MYDIRRVSAVFGLLGAAACLSACAFNPLGAISSSSPTAPSPTGPAAAKSATATAAAGQPVVGAPKSAHTKFAASPAPRPADALLSGGKWGYHSKKKFETSGSYTTALHEDLENDELTDLTDEQSTSLLEIFEDSSKVHHLINASGGRSSDATYEVMFVNASDDAAVDTPWATATLRANFATKDGQKTIECYVYRQKTRKGLDNRPLVSAAIVGYVGADDSVRNPQVKRLD